MQHDEENRTNLLPMQEACILLLSVRVHLNWCTHLIYANGCMHMLYAWIQCRVQQIVCRHCFLTTTGYDNNKGQVLASVYNLSCS